MRKAPFIASLLIISLLFISGKTRAQTEMTIPTGSALNLNFGHGVPDVGPPLQTGFSDFSYTTASGYSSGQYSVVKVARDGGHQYYGPFVYGDHEGYRMVASYDAGFFNKILFGDTIRGLCGGQRYLFWAQISKLGGCLPPSFTFSVETTTGVVIQSAQTGQVGGALAQDNYSWYPGFYDRTKRPAFPFYGLNFQLPSGVSDIVIKIITAPAAGLAGCTAFFAIDNIYLNATGPNVHAFSYKYSGGWIAATCFDGSVPLELSAHVDSGAFEFGTPNYVMQPMNNPAYQWEVSVDDGYTWTDIPGQNSINLSYSFHLLDTFWVRVRVAEAGQIANRSCHIFSNVLQIQVDGPPADFDLKTNSPVCTDGDLLLEVSGGATYNTFGPNGFSDNSAQPHIYHPALADSGWYYSEIYSFGGCRGVDSEYVRVVGPDLRLSPDRTICYGDTVHLFASGGTSYQWTPAEGLSNPAIARPIAAPVTTTRYEVKVSDQTGCSAYGTVVVALRNGLLEAEFSGPEVVCPGDRPQFADTSRGKIVAWQWNFGNGQTSDQRQPPPQVYPVLNDVSLPVKLTITDTSGCQRIATRIVRSVNNCYIAVPTGFTPNHDGLNDFLAPLNAYKATQLEFRVYDRWGRLVFYTPDWTRKWDGTLQGQLLPTAVYVWTLSYLDEHRQRIFLKGTTTLIR